jgi:superfamily II DNA or RNA helicase
MKLRKYQTEGCNTVVSTALGQVVAPTGTGKSVIQGAVFNVLIAAKPGFGIYVILTPRIMLTNQLMQDVGKQLIKASVVISALTIHSGKAAEFSDSEDDDDYTRMVYAKVGNTSTTNSADVITAIEDAEFAKKPLLICCTYDSVPTLTRALRESGKSVDQVLCDEAHYIVEKKFNQNIDNLKPFAEKMHFFTATQKITKGGQGNGMNNEMFYGPVVFRRTPRQMIEEGFMVRPRIHYEIAEQNAAWSRMVSDAFAEHQKQVAKNDAAYNAKMLVCCNGTKTIKEIIDSPGFMEWCKQEEITIFAVSSAYGASIDNKQVDRNKFLKQLKEHAGKAIVLHINILTEGIDVPDITGVMFIRNMGLTRFLQSLGRATRVLKSDIGKATDDFEQNCKLWKKPYAWVIVAERDGDNEGKTADLHQMVEDMRAAGFEPTEEVVIAIDRAKKVKEEFRPCNEKDPKIVSTFRDFFDIQHNIELEKLAALTDDELFDAVPV